MLPLLLALTLPAQLPYTPPEATALAAAWADAQTLPPFVQQTTRYVWGDDVQALAFAFNLLSTNATIRRPVLISQKPPVVRVDLRWLNTDWQTVGLAWEELRFDPCFNLLLTRDTLRFLQDDPVVMVPRWHKEPVAPYVSNGVTYSARWVNRPEQVAFSKSGLDVARLPSDGVDPILFGNLSGALNTQAPVVSLPYFVARGMTAIKGKGLFKTLYGGMYYDLGSIPKAANKGTDLDVLLQSLGVGNADTGFRKLFDQLKSDQRIAIFRSGVTGKPRQAEVLPTLVSRDGRPIVSITSDIRDEDIDLATHPIANLLKFKFAAHEVIWTRANGLHGFALYNAEGKLQEEVPPDIANDSTIPAPHTQRLQPAMGCIRCHGPEGGWRLLTNDVTVLAKVLNIFDDRSDKKKGLDEQIERILGLYGGNLERLLLPQARDAYANAVLVATGPWKESKDQLDVVQRSSARLGQIYASYVYDKIDARRALLELGITPEEDAVGHLKKLLPPVVGVRGWEEDFRIGALKAGLSINRGEFDLVRGFMVGRIKRAWN